MHRAIASLAAWMVALPALAQAPDRELAQPFGWSSSGPSFPYVSAIATPLDDDRVVYAGATQGSGTQSALFQSGDAGASWIDLADAPSGEAVTAIGIDPRNSQNLIALTESDQTAKLYRSADRGATWYHALDTGASCGRSIAFDRVADSAFIACFDRIFRSDDAGITWVRNVSPANDVYGVASSPDGSILAFSSDTIYRSEDAGASWRVVGTAPEACPTILALAVSPDAPETLFVGTGQPTFQHLFCGGVFRSLDGGASWSSADLGLLISNILIDPQEPSRVFASALRCGGFFCPLGGVFMSTDRGETWKDLHFPHDSAGAIALSSSGRTLYAAGGTVFQYRFRRPGVLAPR
jgi:photosystem II stability/assembly factor-like uncharacterized protein